MSDLQSAKPDEPTIDEIGNMPFDVRFVALARWHDQQAIRYPASAEVYRAAACRIRRHLIAPNARQRLSELPVQTPATRPAGAPRERRASGSTSSRSGPDDDSGDPEPGPGSGRQLTSTDARQALAERIAALNALQPQLTLEQAA